MIASHGYRGADLHGSGFDDGHDEQPFLELSKADIRGSASGDQLEPDDACQDEDDAEHPHRRDGLAQ